MNDIDTKQLAKRYWHKSRPSIAQVAREFGLTPAQVRYRLSRDHVPLRQRTPPRTPRRKKQWIVGARVITNLKAYCHERLVNYNTVFKQIERHGKTKIDSLWVMPYDE